ncbi:hypothetical protein V5D56_18930 [Cellulosimicrobium sp. PMB13]|uniref:hypothetical protein n=1 Tax=Cellulosimicrobium sp. PMB13 TaxID=3120158 RepID=UPI003F4B4F3F
MSTTTPAGPPTGLAFYDLVRAYADEVRSHLADLRPDQVEELADGLEADLAEAVVDAPGALPRAAVSPEGADDTTLDLVALFGPAEAYAHELREAAGLPPRAPAPGRRPRIGVRGGLLVLGGILGSGWRSLWQPVTSTPQWATVREFFRALTPVWWVLRGWVAATAVLWAFGGYAVAVLPPDLSARLLLLAAVVVSVQWGRGRWLPLAWMPRAVRYVSVAAAVLALPFAATASAGPASHVSYEQGYQQGVQAATGGSWGGQPVSYDGGVVPEGADGVWVDGVQVSNLFVYDADGNPVRDVQVFDDRGRPVRTVGVDAAYQSWSVPEVDGSWYFQPTLSTDGRERWNVYPLRAVAEEDVEYADDDGRPVPATGTRTHDMPWPFLKAPTEIPATRGTDDGAPSGTDERDEPAAPGDDESEAPAAGTPGGETPVTDAPAGVVLPPTATPTPVVEAVG